MAQSTYSNNFWLRPLVLIGYTLLSTNRGYPIFTGLGLRSELKIPQGLSWKGPANAFTVNVTSIIFFPYRFLSHHQLCPRVLVDSHYYSAWEWSISSMAFVSSSWRPDAEYLLKCWKVGDFTATLRLYTGEHKREDSLHCIWLPLSMRIASRLIPNSSMFL